jgi:hypothetical protein
MDIIHLLVGLEEHFGEECDLSQLANQDGEQAKDISLQNILDIALNA